MGAMTDRMAREEGTEKGVVAIVLSGAGARGAYEAGALSVLLPLLEGSDRPRIIVGTSAGALNAAMLASAIDRGVNPVKALTTDGWERITPKSIFAPPRLSPLRMAERLVRRPVGVSPGLLDTEALKVTLASMLPNPRFASGVARGALDAVAIVASSCTLASAVVFFESRLNPSSKPGVEYVRTNLGLDHLMASSAFPLAFPACWVTGQGQGWYIDGGVHLNTPIKPAIDLGASRVLVVGATPWDTPQLPERATPPSMIDVNGQLLHAMLVDSMRADLRTLVSVNRELLAAPTVSAPSAPASRHRVVEFCVVKPQNDSLSEVAAQIWPSGLLPLIRSLGDYRALGPLTAQRQRPGEFLSYLCFSRDFISEAIACGRSDAQRLVGASNTIPWRSV
jgi:NTE family protein